MTYDSTAETLKHALRVGELMGQPIKELVDRSVRHDRSKTEDPELAIFNEFSPKLRDSTYGSEEYKGFLTAMGDGLRHHYDLDRIIEKAERIERRSTEVRAQRNTDAAVKAGVPEGSVVYYMRIGNRVKIGTSTNLASRLASINPEELLAVERGGVDKERGRHRQFATLRTHGEWFRFESPLTEHIERVRQANP